MSLSRTLLKFAQLAIPYPKRLPFRRNEVKECPAVRCGSGEGARSLPAPAERGEWCVNNACRLNNISFSKEQLMAFVNAWITQEDWDNPKYRLHELAARHPRGFLRPNKKRPWVIDRERNIYLVLTDSKGDMREPRPAHYPIWSMFWKNKFTEIGIYQTYAPPVPGSPR